MKRARWVRCVTVLACAGALPAFIMRCDKAALNFQRGLLQGIGLQVSELAADQLNALITAEEG